MNPSKVWFEKCSECGNDTFYVIVTGYGECASDTPYFCSECKSLEGGVINDPLDELYTKNMEFLDFYALSKIVRGGDEVSEK